MDAKPEFSVPVCPPLLAAALTSSVARLAKLPGLSLPDMIDLRVVSLGGCGSGDVLIFVWVGSGGRVDGEGEKSCECGRK